MSDTARVDSIDSVKAFKSALVKFAEVANVALTSAEGDLRRTQTWLENEQLSHWQTQIRHRAVALSRAKDAVRQKMLFKDSSGRTPTPVDEWKAQKIAQRRLDEAEEKLKATKRAIRLLEKETENYNGSVQRFATMVQVDIPRAIERLDRAHGLLETYVTISAPSAQRADSLATSAPVTDDAESMARPPAEDEVAQASRPRPDGSRHEQDARATSKEDEP